ncbi:mycofactocin-coupled SDR family oxidoreductase [uncultured Mycobacterium sp.]|uniref:mycofactocin-coupled SDR family oxidoreductase n=1 Tax=uncultured Mycobacterium sp. TaxID=171292 RepID=UPI0035C96249
MGNRLEGKVAFITGAARGQGRAHAVRMAHEGADIIAVDICGEIGSNPYPLATQQDLKQTIKLVEHAGRRIIARQADVRERDQLRSALQAGVAEFGHVDIVAANAGILPLAMGDPQPSDFVDATDVDLLGVMNAVAVAIPHLSHRSSIIVTGSAAAMILDATNNAAMGPGGAGYVWAKKTLITYVEEMAYHLAPRSIRVNAIHPTHVNTHPLHNEGMYEMLRPDLERPTRDEAEPALAFFQAMPIPFIEPQDVANLAVFLASDEARYITGQQIRIDAGALIKSPERPRGPSE